MNYRGIEVVCPLCRHDLRPNGADLRCVSCGKSFPVVAGLLDLRVRSDPYVELADDRAIGSALAEQFKGLDFAACVDEYYRQATQVPPGQAQMFRRGLMAAVPRAEAWLKEWMAASGASANGGALLDVGCGTAPLLIAAASRFKCVIGVDIAFRWLVVARQRLEAAGLDLPVICAGAEALPFPAGSFDCVVADSVIEHVWDQPAVLAECYRVMRPAGRLFLATPNRFSLGPDPHVGIWAGGYLPRGWIDGYVRRHGGIPPHRRLLSSRELSQSIEAADFAPPQIFTPGIPPGQRAHFGRVTRFLMDLYNVARRLPVSWQVLRWIGPWLLAVSQKPIAA